MGLIPEELLSRIRQSEMNDCDYEALEGIMGKSYEKASFHEIDDAQEILRERIQGAI